MGQWRKSLAAAIDPDGSAGSAGKKGTGKASSDLLIAPQPKNPYPVYLLFKKSERFSPGELRQAVEQFVEQLGLSLSPEKTHVTTFRQGFAFLGFDVTSHSVKMRVKSVEKFKTRIRELTIRSHNLDASKVEKLNAVIRGVARYFATWFTKCSNQFRELDRWLRMRLRCMRLKRKSRMANCRIKIKHLRRRGCDASGPCAGERLAGTAAGRGPVRRVPRTAKRRHAGGREEGADDR